MWTVPGPWGHHPQIIDATPAGSYIGLAVDQDPPGWAAAYIHTADAGRFHFFAQRSESAIVPSLALPNKWIPGAGL